MAELIATDQGSEEDAQTLSFMHYIELLNSLFEKKDLTAPQTSAEDALCKTRHFLAQYLTNISLQDDTQQEIGKFDLNNTTPALSNEFASKAKQLNASHVVAHYGHLQAECSTNGKKIRISGYKFDYQSDNPEEATMALQERAKAALIAAYHARDVLGLENVDFGKTTDPVERFMLFLACKHTGLNISNVNPQELANNLPAELPLTKINKSAMAAEIMSRFQNYVESPGNSFELTSEISQRTTEQRPEEVEFNI